MWLARNQADSRQWLLRAVASAAVAAIATGLMVAAFTAGFYAGYVAGHHEIVNPGARWMPGQDLQ